MHDYSSLDVPLCTWLSEQCWCRHAIDNQNACWLKLLHFHRLVNKAFKCCKCNKRLMIFFLFYPMKWIHFSWLWCSRFRHIIRSSVTFSFKGFWFWCSCAHLLNIFRFIVKAIQPKQLANSRWWWWFPVGLLLWANPFTLPVAISSFESIKIMIRAALSSC